MRKLRNHKEVLVSRRFHMTHNLNGIRIGIPSATCTFFRCTLRMSCRPFTSGMGTVILVSNRPGLIRALCDAHYEGLVLIKIGSAVKTSNFPCVLVISVMSNSFLLLKGCSKKDSIKYV